MAFIARSCTKIFVVAASLAFSAGLIAAPAAAQNGKMSLAARVQAIEDREAIQDLLIEYGHDLDTRDYTAYSNLFAKDGQWSGNVNGGYNTYTGPAAILAMLSGGRTPPPFDPKNVRSFHLMTNIVVHVDGDHATAQSKWTTMVRGPDDKPVPGQAGHYDDTFVREGGVWKFQHRIAPRDMPPQ